MGGIDIIITFRAPTRERDLPNGKRIAPTRHNEPERGSAANAPRTLSASVFQLTCAIQSIRSFLYDSFSRIQIIYLSNQIEKTSAFVKLYSYAIWEIMMRHSRFWGFQLSWALCLSQRLVASPVGY
jgi:hypothetical protein